MDGAGVSLGSHNCWGWQLTGRILPVKRYVNKQNPLVCFEKHIVCDLWCMLDSIGAPSQCTSFWNATTGSHCSRFLAFQTASSYSVLLQYSFPQKDPCSWTRSLSAIGSLPCCRRLRHEHNPVLISQAGWMHIVNLSVAEFRHQSTHMQA